jgi:hypothetical protein
MFQRKRLFTEEQFIWAAFVGMALCVGMLAGSRHAAGAVLPSHFAALPAHALAHSYSVPAYGSEERVTRIYQAGDGHFVLAFSYRDHGMAKVDYFDTLSGARLFPGQEDALATDNGLERKLLPAGLKLLTPDSDVTAFNGATVHADSEAGSRCGFPYASPITIDPPAGKPEVRVELFARRPAPGFWKGACSEETVALHYEETGYQLFNAGGEGVLVDTDSRHLIFIGWDGHCDMSAENSDIIAVPYEKLRDILFDDADDSVGPGPAAFARAEAFIRAHAR